MQVEFESRYYDSDLLAVDVDVLCDSVIAIAQDKLAMPALPARKCAFAGINSDVNAKLLARVVNAIASISTANESIACALLRRFTVVFARASEAITIATRANTANDRLQAVLSRGFADIANPAVNRDELLKSAQSSKQ